ncbi:MAG: hypothetical protein M0T74_11550 [Desulfitobacterium hafniense]|nr:hypothetical protein [Desulfitobacterium hafniense]
MRILHLPLGRSTFCMDEAEIKLNSVHEGFNRIGLDVESPNNLLLELEALEEFLDQTLAVNSDSVDAVIVQPITFTDARFMRIILDKVSAPVIIWSVREPHTDGRRLCLNSLTGANIYATEMRNNRYFVMVHGDPSEPGVMEDIKRKCQAFALRKSVSNQKILVIGENPDGFFFSQVPPVHLTPLGIEFVKCSLEELFNQAKNLSEDKIKPEIDSIVKAIAGTKQDDEKVILTAKVLHVVKGWVQSEGATAVASRCWPDFFVNMNVAPCGMISMLNEIGIPAACEADMFGAISMALLKVLSNSPALLGDLVHLDESANSLTFWHCGAAAPCLAGAGVAKPGVHPNRKIGLSVEMSGKSGEVTVTRLGLDGNKLRLFVMEGNATGAPQKFLGTSIEVIPNGGSAREIMLNVMGAGYEPHYAVGYGHWASVLVEWAKSVGIEVDEF